MQYINKKRAVSHQLNHSLNKLERTKTSFNELIQETTEKYNNIIYLTLIFIGVFALLFGVKPLCRLILMVGGVL